MSHHYKKPLPDKLCLIPFMGFQIHSNGSWQLCPSSREKVPLNLGENASFIWSSEFLHSVRKKMLDNKEVIPNCSGCYQLEKEGVDSKRMRFNKKRLKLYGEDICYHSVYSKEKPVLELDLSFSNFCNLDCVMCNSEYSSSWIKKDQKAIAQGLTFRKSTNKKVWKIKKPFIDSLIDSNIKDLRLILIKGGEPLIEPNCLYFLRKLSEKRKKGLTVYIQTNGTVMDSKVISAIADLNVEISFSVDGLGNHYNWIRGFDFNEIVRNFEQLDVIKNLRHSYFTYTVSAFNFHRVSEFIEFFIEKKEQNHKLRRLSFSIAHENYLNCRVFSQKVRKKCVQQIQETVRRLKVKKDFLDGYTPLLQELSMEQLDESSAQKFQKWLSFCNSLRRKKLQDIDPYFNKLLKEYL